MKTSISLVLALASSGAVLQIIASPAQAAETPAQRAGRAAIVATYKKQDQALVKKDLKFIMSIMAPDYRMTTMGQTFNRTQTEAMMRQTITGAGAPISYSQSTTRLVSLTWRGRDAVAIVEATATGVLRQGGRTGKIKQASVGQDVWTPTSTGWKVRQSVEREAKVWLDGKRIR